MHAVATVLDELSGFEFEEVMADAFRHQRYCDIRQAVHRKPLENPKLTAALVGGMVPLLVVLLLSVA